MAIAKHKTLKKVQGKLPVMNNFKNKSWPDKPPIFDFYPSKSGKYNEIFFYLGTFEASPKQSENAGALHLNVGFKNKQESSAFRAIFYALCNDIRERHHITPTITIISQNIGAYAEVLRVLKQLDLDFNFSPFSSHSDQ